MRSGVRFRPPLTELSAELRWVLRRAFGPPDSPWLEGDALGSDVVFDLVERLDLVARIGARTPMEMLAAEIGTEVAGRFREEYSAGTALSLVVEQVCREVAEAGRDHRMPTIFLKGAALQLYGRVAPGSRTMCDVDVLVPVEGAGRLQEAMVAAGCQALDVPESEHQMQYLTHRTGLGVEVHLMIPGVRLEGDTSVTADQLLQTGMCRSLPSLSGSCFVPDDQVTLAHLLVHGIAQHGFAPHAYPLSRLLADVQDFELDEAEWEAFLAGGSGWIQDDVSREEVGAVRGLVERLEVGEDPGVIAAGGDEPGVLLRHLVAGVLDESYLRAMKFRSLAAKPVDVGRPRSVLKTVRNALWPARAQIDILYGRPRSELGYWGWHLWRPFDLVGRAVRYGVAAIRHRMRN
jgi:hypothetical protein